MFKEKLSKISTRILYILFAVVVSITLWLYVEITENDILTSDVSNVEVVFKNEDLLRDKGLLRTSVVPETLTITFEASRADINRLVTPGAVTVEVDLSAITTSGTQLLAYEINLPQGVSRNAIEIRGVSAARISVTFDRMLSRPLPVMVSYTGGTASEELFAETVEFDPQTVTVWGPEAVVSRIHHVRVPIYMENLRATYTEDLEFILIDENDEVLDESLRDSLEFSQSTIRVTVPVKEIKDVPLIVMLSHGTSTSDANTQWRVEPVSIKVSGDPEAIREINSITLGTIDMLSFGLTYAVPFPIVIPNHLSNISGEISALVHVEVFGQDIAFRSTSNLQVINTPPGHRTDILTQSLDIRLRGNNDDLALITSLNLSVVADLTGRNPGTSRIPAKIYIHGIDADIDAVGDYEITVTIVAE